MNLDTAFNMADENENTERVDGDSQKPEKMFTLKKWNAVAMWSWDVECDTCAICRVQVMGYLDMNESPPPTYEVKIKKVQIETNELAGD
ncbi:hypothetical protein J437_LFUL008983 [Ladona fulva]|uniref:RING-box protein 2 n=1 Tax=Ladona fulva TaxID=123851 RepID=A0A8K0K539_LADFU|nr:hypothetical protein J437_LFUL008983 [Ladona fulva]